MAKNNMPPKKQTTPKFAPSGAFVRTISTMREMKTYCLNENELRGITLLNTATSIFGSLFVTFVLFAIGLKVDAVIEGILTEQAALLAQFGFWVFVVAAIICGVIAVVAWRCRSSMLQHILGETRAID